MSTQKNVSNLVSPVEVRDCLSDCQETLKDHFVNLIMADAIEPTDLKLAGEYYKWVNLKTKLIASEKSFAIPCNALPNKISAYLYSFLYESKRAIIDKYYKRNAETGYYVINAKKSNILQKDIDVLVHSLMLKRGNVVWAHLGFNVGREFGGKHPVLILRNSRDTLFVLPLSSQTPSNPDINVRIDSVHGLPQRTRWGNVMRIVPISILRVDFDNHFGDVKGAILSEVSEMIKIHGVK